MAENDEPENRLIAERRAKLARLREAGVAYPNDFRRDSIAAELLAAYQGHSVESLAATPVEVRVAGRLMVKRVMGGTSFVKLQDRSGQIQLMLKRDRLTERLAVTEQQLSTTSSDGGDVGEDPKRHQRIDEGLRMSK